MSVDTRAYAWCNLGPLADGASSIADSHVQGSGVITTKGTINLAGIVRPTPGAVVELAYSRDGQNWIARIPRRLRVLSSFANPLGGKTTSISVGCDLAYYEARKQPPNSLTARQANPDTPEIVWRAAAPAIPASWLVQQILAALGLTAAGTIPLTNHYTRQEFDLTAGYVEELGKLAASEGYAVRMTPAGLVEFISKDVPLGRSVLITEDDLIDLNPINTGDLPGDAVYANYNSLSLLPPDIAEPDPLDILSPSQIEELRRLEEEGENPDPKDIMTPEQLNELEERKEQELQKRNYELEVSISAPQKYIHQWTEYQRVPVLDDNGNPVFKQRKDANGKPVYYIERSSIFNGVETTILGGAVMDQVFEVRAYQLAEEISYITRTTTKTNYDDNDRVTVRTTWSQGQWALDYTETSYTYDSEGDVVLEKTVSYSSLAPIKLSVGYQGSYIFIRGTLFGDQYQSGYREVRYERNKAEGITKTATTSLVPFISTVEGTETMSRYRDAGNQLDQSRLGTLLGIAKQLVSAGTEVRISTAREYGLQKRPSEAQRSIDANKKELTSSGSSAGAGSAGGAGNSSSSAPSPEFTVKTVWAVGSTTSQTSIELSPPYSPDDRIIAVGSGYTVVKSDASQKALHYARIENRLLLGHRNGVGIQVLPEMLPAEPMGLVFIRLNGCTAAFRINGTTYNIDPQGVTATTDALFWGAIDGTVADAWFPLPPGASSLPAPVAITTNASPQPANAIAIPSGFSFTDPNPSSLFASLPTAQPPVFAATQAPAVLIKPYAESLELAAGGGGGAFVTTLPWAPQTVELTVGAGGGAFANITRRLVAGGGAGAFASVSSAITLLAGGGGGAFRELIQEGGAMLAFTSGTSMAWSLSGSNATSIYYYGYSFTLTTARQIKAVGFYDAGGDGLSHSYEIYLFANWGETLSFYGDEFIPIKTEGSGDDPNGLTELIPIGTAASLDGVWRKVVISNGVTLQPGTYAVAAAFYDGGELDSLIKNASGLTTLPSVTINGPFRINFNDQISSPTGDGPGYFGPVLFF